jgi:calcineurin-like phosphoesterase family protein
VSVFYSSDQHFGHANIIGYCNRPFADVSAMNEALVERWNAVVGVEDEVFVLGDVAMRIVPDGTLVHVSRLNGTKHLVAGNHDRCWEGNRNGASWLRRYRDAGFATVATSTTRTVAGRDVLLCHFPYAGDSHGSDRYAWARPVDTGLWLLHGHVHDAWKVNGRQINVGCDVWGYAPVAEHVLADIMAAA